MSRVSQFTLGLKKLFEGFGFLLRTPKLWFWTFLPWAIAMILLIVSWELFMHHYNDFYHLLASKMGLETLTREHGFWAALIYAGLWILKQILKVLLFLVGLILISLISFLVYCVAAAPFLDLLAEKVSLLSEGKEPPPFQWKRFLKSMGQSVAVELKKALLFLTLPILLWFLNFIPIAGSFLFLLLTCLFGMWVLGLSCVDYPMGHQLIPFRARLKFALKFKFALIGFGLPFLIPFAPLFLQAPMVVGGTLLYHELQKKLPTSNFQTNPKS